MAGFFAGEDYTPQQKSVLQALGELLNKGNENTLQKLDAIKASPTKESFLSSFGKWANTSQAPLANDLRRVTNWIDQNPLQATGTAAAAIAAPFTGGGSLATLGALAGGYGVGSAANYGLKYSGLAPAKAPEAAVGGKNGMLLPPGNGDMSLFQGQNIAQGGGMLPAPKGDTMISPPVAGTVSNAAVPQMQMPVGVDLTEAQKLLDSAAPKEMSAEDIAKQESADKWAVLAGIMQGFGQGDTVGSSLLGAGIGGATAKAQNERDALKRAAVDAEDKRKFAMQQADFALKKAAQKADDTNAIHKAMFENEKMVYEHAAQRAKENKPKILNANGYNVVVQNADGSIVVKDTGMIDKMLTRAAAMKGLGQSNQAISLSNAKMAASQDPIFGPFQAKAVEAYRSGKLYSEAEAAGIGKQMEEARKIATKEAQAQFGLTNTRATQNAVDQQMINLYATFMMQQASGE